MPTWILLGVFGTVGSPLPSVSDAKRSEESVIPIGTSIMGRYRVVREIARGSAGLVFEAEQLPIERHVALKVMSCAGKSELFGKRFRREAAVSSRLSHPNVVPIYDFGVTDDGLAFLAMELVEGPSLQDVLHNEGALPLRRALYIALQIVRALRRAHSLGVVHRDLKPANIMTLPDEDGLDFIKVLDFGLVKVLAPEMEVFEESVHESLTRAGALLGTPGFMAPEQATGDAVDGRADLYTVGVVLFQMLTGRIPFTGDTVAQVISAQVTERVPFITEVQPELQIPEELETIVQRCLQRDPDKRYRDAEHLLQALKYVWHLDTGETFGTEASLLPLEGVAVLQEPLGQEQTVEQSTLHEPQAPAPGKKLILALTVAVIVVAALAIVTMIRLADPIPQTPLRIEAKPSQSTPAVAAPAVTEPSEELSAGDATEVDEKYKDNPY